MKGTYVVRQNGQEIGRFPNIITSLGKQQIAKSISTQGNLWASKIALGCGGAVSSANGLTAPAATDKFLDFEFSRSGITTIVSQPNTPNAGAIRIIVKSVIPDVTAGRISEIGIFSSASIEDQFINPLFNAESSEFWQYVDAAGTTRSFDELMGSSSTAPLVSTSLTTDTNFRFGVGSEVIAFERIPVNASKRTVSVAATFDMSSVNSADNILTAFYKKTTSTSTLTIKFCVNASSYFSANISSSAAGYQIVSTPKSSFASSGSPSWSSISYIEIADTTSPTPSSGEYVYLDSMRVKKAVSDDQNILVSRTVLSDNAAIKKIQGVPLEIEYYLDLFNTNLGDRSYFPDYILEL